VQVRVEEPEPRRFVVAPSGELDMATTPVLDRAVGEVLARDDVAALVVDLTEVRFMDSSGIRALLQARNAVAERGGQFSLTRPSEQVAVVLRAAALDHIFDIDGHGQPPLEV
jgi:anti-sigma B factor antagonist